MEGGGVGGPGPEAKPGGTGPPQVPVHGPLTEARFRGRPNRFLVRAEVEGGSEVAAHLPDPGRLTELLVPGRRLWLRRATAPGRKTGWTAVLVEAPGGGLVSVDTALPNRLVRHALRSRALPELRGWSFSRAEVPAGGSRIDFLLTDRAGRRLFLEVKSVTLVRGGLGLFPDAVTARGARHVRELAGLARRAETEAAVLFVVQRRDATRVTAAPEIDPAFASALAAARSAGVRTLGRRCRVELDRVVLGEAIPVA